MFLWLLCQGVLLSRHKGGPQNAGLKCYFPQLLLLAHVIKAARETAEAQLMMQGCKWNTDNILHTKGNKTSGNSCEGQVHIKNDTREGNLKVTHRGQDTWKIKQEGTRTQKCRNQNINNNNSQARTFNDNRSPRAHGPWHWHQAHRLNSYFIMLTLINFYFPPQCYYLWIRGGRLTKWILEPFGPKTIRHTEMIFL